MKIDITSPHDIGVATVIAAHNAHCNAISPADSCHNLTADELDAPDITVWAAVEGSQTIGIGALKALDPAKGEVKSMHTTAKARGKGTARAILRAIEATAASRGHSSLWLETGTAPEFAPARYLYESEGYNECPPFGVYIPDPNSCFYTKPLTSASKGLDK